MDRVLITGFPKLLARRMALRLHAGGAQVSLLVLLPQATSPSSSRLTFPKTTQSAE